MATMYEKLAEDFKEDPEVMVARINALANDLEVFKIETYPSFK